MALRPIGLVTLGLLALASCERPEAGGAETGARGSRTPGAFEDVVDSVRPRTAALRAFQAKLPPVDSLGGMTSRDHLVFRFVQALERQDTMMLASLAVTQGEFAYLYYPTARESFPPYDLSPELLWFVMFGQSDLGVRRLLAKRGGQPLNVVRYTCPATPVVEGENQVWRGCVIYRRNLAGAEVQEQFFAQILERGGRFKFLSFANALD